MGTNKSFEEIQEFNKNMKEIEQDRKNRVVDFIHLLMGEFNISIKDVEQSWGKV